MTGVMERLGITYKELGYRGLQLDVFYPENKKGGLLPGIILVHGGGWKSGDRTLQIPLAKALAAKGYVTAVVDYRLSLEARFPAAVFDIKDAVKWLKSNGEQFRLDSNKIAVSGSSAGGQLANLVGFTNGQSRYEESSLSSNSSEVHAIINMDGVLAFHHPESEEGEMAALWLGGTYAEIPEIWKAASPLSQVSEIARPILFINSQFQRFHAGRDEVIAQMEAFGIYTEVQTVENSPHTFWLFSPWFDPTADLMDRFLKRVF